jgi:glutamate-5-semialdehyde dehydrogenase
MSMQAVEGSAGDLGAIMNGIGHAAAASRMALAQSSGAVRNAALLAAARALRSNTSAILAANARDMDAARARGLSPAMLDRLQLNEKRVESMAAGVEQIAALADPIGGVSAEWTRPNGLKIQRVRVPLGVIGIIYESRPNVTADAGALCLKSANPVILRGGSESRLSSAAIHGCLVDGLRAAGLPEAAIQLVPTSDRAAVGMMLAGLDQQINVIVPRGGRSLVERVQKEARVPVIGHLEGLCHVYVDRDADADMARAVVVNAKLRRTGICGAAETLLVDKDCEA